MTHDPWPLHHFILRMGLGGSVTWWYWTTLSVLRSNKKARLTQGLRATAPSFQDGGCSKMAVTRHLGYYRTANSTIRSIDPEKPCLGPDMEWIGCTVCEIFTFKLYCDLETGVRGHSRSSKTAPLDRPPFLYVQDGRQPPSWILSNRK